MAQNVSSIMSTEGGSESSIKNIDLRSDHTNPKSEEFSSNNNYDQIEETIGEVKQPINCDSMACIESDSFSKVPTLDQQSSNHSPVKHVNNPNTLNVQDGKETPVSYDSDSCTSSNDSTIEMNIESLNINSISPTEDKKQEFSKSIAVKYDLPSIEFVQQLEAHNSGLESELSELRKALNVQKVAFKDAESQIRTEFLSNIEKLSKECNVLRKDKEAMVIRYANSEKEVINEKKARQDLEKKLKDLNKERDNFMSKIKHLNSENTRLSSFNDGKMSEITKLQKHFEKLKSDFNAREIRIKWLQNNLKTETNSHQETQAKLDQTMQRLNIMKEEAEQVRRDCQEMIKCYQEDEEIKSVKLDSQLKQKVTELEVQKQEKSDQEQVYQLLRQELESLKKKQRMTMEENSSLTLKIHNLEKNRLEYEQNLSKLKDSQNLLKEEVVDLTARLAEMETLQLQLEREKEKSAASLREIERLRSTNAELQSDMNACHRKEGELLKFTEGVTDTNVKLQSSYSLLDVKSQALEDELAETKRQLAEFQEKYLHSVSALEKIRKEHEEEGQLLARKLAEKIKNVEKLNMKLDEAENENRVLKRRHIASIKELSRELYECKRRLDGYETTNIVRCETSSLGSRTSSAASLDVINSENKGNTFFPSSPSKSLTVKVATNEKCEPDLPGIDKEMLIEKIIKLQKQLVAKNERIDFLKDHIVHLVKEMKKRCKCDDLKTV